MSSLQKFDEAYLRLQQYTAILGSVAAARKDEVRRCVARSGKVPSGCPSQASWAATVFDKVNEIRDEVNAAIHDVEQAIWKGEE